MNTPTDIAGGSWLTGALWRIHNAFVIFGDQKGIIAHDSSQHISSWNNVMIIDLESFGVYQPPPLELELTRQELCLAALRGAVETDFEIICDDGCRIRCSKIILQARWPWFESQIFMLAARLKSAMESSVLPPQKRQGDSTPYADELDERITLLEFDLAESRAVTVALLQYFYATSLLTKLQQEPEVLGRLLELSVALDIPRLQSLAKHAMHMTLSEATCEIYEAVTCQLDSCEGLHQRYVCVFHYILLKLSVISVPRFRAAKYVLVNMLPPSERTDSLITLPDEQSKKQKRAKEEIRAANQSLSSPPTLRPLVIPTAPESTGHQFPRDIKRRISPIQEVPHPTPAPQISQSPSANKIPQSPPAHQIPQSPPAHQIPQSPSAHQIPKSLPAHQIPQPSPLYEMPHPSLLDTSQSSSLQSRSNSYCGSLPSSPSARELPSEASSPVVLSLNSRSPSGETTSPIATGGRHSFIKILSAPVKPKNSKPPKPRKIGKEATGGRHSGIMGLPPPSDCSIDLEQSSGGRNHGHGIGFPPLQILAGRRHSGGAFSPVSPVSSVLDISPGGFFPRTPVRQSQMPDHVDGQWNSGRELFDFSKPRLHDSELIVM
jgi:hypothetical protein